MRKDIAIAGARPFMPDEAFVALIEALMRIRHDRLKAVRAPFWQQDWKKHRRRAWKRRRSAGIAR